MSSPNRNDETHSQLLHLQQVIPLGHCHAIKAITELTFIEVLIDNPLVEEDIERIEYNW